MQRVSGFLSYGLPYEAVAFPLVTTTLIIFLAMG